MTHPEYHQLWKNYLNTQDVMVLKIIADALEEDGKTNQSDRLRYLKLGKAKHTVYFIDTYGKRRQVTISNRKQAQRTFNKAAYKTIFGSTNPKWVSFLFGEYYTTNMMEKI